MVLPSFKVSGKLSISTFTSIPTPTITFSMVLNFAIASVKIPQVFLPLMNMSFGHLISGFSIPIFSRVFATATPVANVINGSADLSFENKTLKAKIYELENQPKPRKKFLGIF